MKKIRVIHETGMPSHYAGLAHYCREEGIELSFHEFSWDSQLKNGVRNVDMKKIGRAFKNSSLLFSLLFKSRETIVMGIAPYDYRMIFVNFLAKKHSIYYHTSWPYWDGSNYPKRKFSGKFLELIKRNWKTFLEKRCSGIFCVSGFAKKQLTDNYQISAPIQVVYHSIDTNIFHSKEAAKKRSLPLKVLYVGRLLEKKGLLEICNLTKTYDETVLKIGIVGSGEIEKTIKNRAAENPSQITFYGRQPRNLLGDIYREYDVLLCPSKKGYGAWEELFGITIIEGMACGLIPLATKHVGPREIINPSVDGLLIDEDGLEENLKSAIDSLLHLPDQDFERLKDEAVARSATFRVDAIAKRWQNLFDLSK